MESLYNWHVQRFYQGKPYQTRFRKRLWEHRWTLWHLAKNLPMLMKAKTHFTHEGVSVATQLEKIPLHECQPKQRLAAGTTSNTVFEDVPLQFLPPERRTQAVEAR
jgi:hypothetical protein